MTGKSDAKWRVVGLVLVLLGLAYYSSGAMKIQGEAKDMHYRVNGLEKILAHEVPYPEVWEDRGGNGIAPDAPWGWLSNLVIYPPAAGSHHTAVYLVLMTIALAAMLAWGYWAVGDAPSEQKFMGLAAVFAVSSFCTCIGLGQNAIFEIAALAGLAYCLQRRLFWIAGLFLGMALCKPNVGALFILPLLVQWRPKVLLAMAVFLMVSMGWICFTVKMGPLDLVQTWKHYVDISPPWPGYDFSSLLMGAGLAKKLALNVAALTGLLVCAGLCVAYRRSSTLTLLAICAVIGRLWTYHQLYDNAMIMILMIALWVLYTRTKKGLVLGTFLAVGLTLWLPGRATDFWVFPYAQMAIWCAGLAVYLGQVGRVDHNGMRESPVGKLGAAAASA